jgi:hypothetical protein
VQIKATHPGHVEVDDQAAGAAQFGRAQELLSRRKCLGDESHRTHQYFDCPSNRFIVIDDGNYWSVIWHFGKPITANSVIRSNGCCPRDFFLIQPRRNRYMLRLYKCIGTQRLVSPDWKFLWSMEQAAWQASTSNLAPVSSKEPLQLGLRWRGKGRPQGAVGLGGGDFTIVARIGAHY